MGTLSRIVPGTSRNTGVENQEPTGDRSQNDCYLDMESSIYQSRSSLESDPQEASHMVTGVEEKSHNAPLGLLQGKKRRAAQINHYFVVTMLLRHLKQSRFDWPFGRWQPIAKFNKTITQI